MMNELYEVISVNKPTYVFVRSYCQLKAYFDKKKLKKLQLLEKHILDLDVTKHILNGVFMCMLQLNVCCFTCI